MPIDKGDIKKLLSESGRFVGYLKGISPFITTEEAEDIFLKYLARLWRLRGEVDSSTLENYTFVSLRQNAIKLAEHDNRKKRKRNLKYFTDGGLFDPDGGEKFQRPNEEFMSRDTFKHISSLLDDDEDKKILNLLFVEGDSMDSAAKKMGVSDMKVAARKKRMISFLKAKMGSLGDCLYAN